MNGKILLVDDDERLLSGLVRQLEERFFLLVAHSGEAGLRKMEQEQEIAAVVSDLRMPGMGGLEFLKEVKTRYPECVRLLLTAHADIDLALKVVNDAQIFRFMVKPCSAETVADAIDAALKQYHLIRSEQDLLRRTLMGSVQILTEIIAAVDPVSFSDIPPLREVIHGLCKELGATQSLEIELAAMLCQLGAVTIPPPILVKLRTFQELSEQEQQAVDKIPHISAELLSHIPRLESVVKIIRMQGKDESIAGEKRKELGFAAEILRLARAYVQLAMAGSNTHDAFASLQGSNNPYREDVVNALGAWLSITKPAPAAEADSERLVTRREKLSLPVAKLVAGDRLLQDVRTKSNVLLLKAGVFISEPLLLRLQNYRTFVGVNEPMEIERVLS